MKQTTLFGEEIEVTAKNTIDSLPRPVNDWAYCLYILIDSKKGMTALDAAGTYGVIKFQERINEVGNTFDGLLDKKKIRVRKRLNRVVEVMCYKINDVPLAFDVYRRINQKGGSKILKKTDRDE